MEGCTKDKGSRIVIVTVGTRGDVQPFIALAVELTSRGHLVWIASHAEYEAFVVSRCPLCKYVPLEGSPSSLLADPRFLPAFTEASVSHELSFARECSSWQRTNRNLLSSLVSPLQPSLLIAGVGSAMDVASLAQRLGVPSILCCTFPVWPSWWTLPTLIGAREMPVALARFFTWIGERIGFRYVREDLNAWRATMGLDPLTYPSMCHMPHVNLFSPAVAPRPPDWPTHVYDTNFWFLENDETPLPEHLETFLQQGTPPLYFGFGSMPLDTESLGRMFLKLCRETQARGIFCASSLPESLIASFRDANILHIVSASHTRLFPRCRVVIHHGGAGTTAAVLRAGTPNVIFPFLSSVLGDQVFWARCCANLKVAPSTVLTIRELNESTLLSQVKEVLNNPTISENAKALSVHIRNGVSDAATLIERLMDWMRPSEQLHSHWSEKPKDQCPSCSSKYGFFGATQCRCATCGLYLCTTCAVQTSVMNYDIPQFICPDCEAVLSHDGKSNPMPI